MKFGKKNQLIHPHRINYEIRSLKVRLTNFNGDSMGIINLKDALAEALECGLDLVEISPNAEPPVCKIMNYGKFLYEKSKTLKKQKKKQKVVHIKEIKFRPSTGEGDYNVKLRNLVRFLKDGDKVKITLRFRGREMAHQHIGKSLLLRIKHDLDEISVVEFFPTRIEGRQMVMMLAPKKI